ncbi:MAG: hypothetical protein QGH51_09360, partial [Planctomycetota bacterium]|nr:hypothetical protein [Planctomycetota bacterium]
GVIKNAQQVEFDVPPGKHHLNLRIDWCRSNIVEFEVNQDTVEFECGSNLRGFKLLLGIFYMLFLHSKYIWLKKK